MPRRMTLLVPGCSRTTVSASAEIREGSPASTRDPGACAHAPTSMIRFGIDRLLRDGEVRRGLRPELRIGQLTNDDARLAGDPATTPRRAMQSAGLNLVRLFSPQARPLGPEKDGRGSRRRDRHHHRTAGGDPVGDVPSTTCRRPVRSGWHGLRPSRCGRAVLHLHVDPVPSDEGPRRSFAAPLGPRPPSSPGRRAARRGGAHPPRDPDPGNFLGQRPIPIRDSLTLGELALLLLGEQGLDLARLRARPQPAAGPGILLQLTDVSTAPHVLYG